jgi:adenylylsulfate kinase-like enzyme
MGLVVVTGLPGSGNSAISALLSGALGLPLLSKDRFKEILFDVLGVRDRMWSREIGQAAIAIQYEVMRTVRSAVVDSGLWTGRSEPEIESLGLPVVQVYCECPFEIARERYFRRLASGTRHSGFAAEGMTTEDFEMFRPLHEPLRLSAPLVRVDTSVSVESDALETDVRAALASVRTGGC